LLNILLRGMGEFSVFKFAPENKGFCLVKELDSELQKEYTENYGKRKFS